MISPGIGDILVVRTAGWPGRLIRAGAFLAGKPDLDNHVAIVHHVTGGVTWCVEGRPGGVGWRDATAYLASPWTVTNAGQPRTTAQRELVRAVAEAALHAPYDWPAIAADAMDDLHLPALWERDWRGQGSPGHFVCSSLAAWAHWKAGIALPAVRELAMAQPADWTRFCLDRPWER